MRDEHNRYGQPPALPVPLTFDAFRQHLAQLLKIDAKPIEMLALSPARVTELLATTPAWAFCVKPPPPGIVAVIYGVSIRSHRAPTMSLATQAILWPTPRQP